MKPPHYKITYSDKGGPWVIHEEITNNGKGNKCSFNDEPSYVGYHSDGTIKTQRWHNKEGEVHRDGDKPASISSWPGTGNVVSKEWRKNGVFHRDEGKPALVFYENGEVAAEEYWTDGKYRRRSDKP